MAAALWASGKPDFVENNWTVSVENVLFVYYDNEDGKTKMRGLGVISSVNYTKSHQVFHGSKTKCFLLGLGTGAETKYVVTEESFKRGKTNQSFVAFDEEVLDKARQQKESTGQWLRHLLRLNPAPARSGEDLDVSIGSPSQQETKQQTSSMFDSQGSTQEVDEEFIPATQIDRKKHRHNFREARSRQTYEKDARG
jgi:hypothetical protein